MLYRLSYRTIFLFHSGRAATVASTAFDGQNTTRPMRFALAGLLCHVLRLLNHCLVPVFHH